MSDQKKKKFKWIPPEYWYEMFIDIIKPNSGFSGPKCEH